MKNPKYKLYFSGRNDKNSLFTNQIELFFNQQLDTWLLLQDGVQNLSLSKSKILLEKEHKLILQLNPQRLKSTNADLNENLIKNRPCFLCPENLPAEQKAILVEDDFLMLCNPYPIFKKHFTIVYKMHKPQNISRHILSFLNISKKISPDFNIFYNGAECGASAPDHLHFQVCPRLSTPIENENELIMKNSNKIIDRKNLKILSSAILERKFFTIISNDIKAVEEVLYKSMELLGEIYNSEKEPKFNLFCWYGITGWTIHIFPREKHRPDQFFFENEKKIFVSPAAIDYCGTVVTPSEENFNTLNLNDIKDIFRQTSMSNEYFEYAKVKLKRISG